MKKTMKLLSVILTLSMLVSLLSACVNFSEFGDSAGTADATTATGSGETTGSGEAVTDDPNGGQNDPPVVNKDLVKITTLEMFTAFVEQVNENPSITKGKTYKLFLDITLVAGWDASPASAYGKLVAPDAIAAFPGLKEFYGTFDGNGKTISCIYRVDTEAAGGAVGGFIDKLNGGTVKNLTVNSAYVYDNGAKGAAVGGLVGVVNGNGASIENVTVNAGVYSATDGDAVIGGVVGKIAADGFTMKNVTFGGKAGNVGADLTIPSVSTTATLGQMIGDADGKAVTLSGCAANGALICNSGAVKDNFCGTGAASVTNTDSSVNAPADAGIVEITEYKIYNATELLSLAAYNSTFEGKTVKLMDNIDLNPGWEADTSVPANVWTGLTEFKGTFDGNSRFIKGIYRTDSDGGNVGFIDKLAGGTVKNLIILDSAFISASETVAANVGFIGCAEGGTVEALSVEANVYVTGAADANAGGIVGSATGATALTAIAYNGMVSAEGKTAALIVADTADAVLTDILALGTGGSAPTGTHVLTEKKDEAFLTDNADYADWSYTTYFEAVAPKAVSAILKALSVLIPDDTWYNETDTTFVLTTPEQLLGLSVLAQNNTFEGKTIELGANINLNPAWDATTKVASNGVVTVAITPKNAWTPIPLFKGTIDGKGYTISGIYSYTDYNVPTSTPRYMGGFINVLENGTLKNLVVDNSLAYFTSSTGTSGTSNRILIGGFIGHVLDANLDTLYVDIDAWNYFAYHYTMGGMICCVDTAASDDIYKGEIKNIVYAGSSGRIHPDDNTYSTKGGTDGVFTAGMIAQNKLASGSNCCYVAMKNLAFIGVWYKAFSKSQSGDPLLGYTGSGSYNQGMTVDNSAIYTDAIPGGKDSSTHWNTTKGLSDAADDITGNNKVAVDKDVSYSTNSKDTYEAAGWKTMVIENSAGLTTPILLPGTVVDMLTAANNG